MPGKRKSAPTQKNQRKNATSSWNRNGRRSDAANLNDRNDSNNDVGHRNVNRRQRNQTETNVEVTRPTQVTAARFREDNAMVEISTEGQDTEFDNEGSSQTDSMDSEEEAGVGSNNNATVVDTRRTAGLEDGEVEEPQPGPSTKRLRSNQAGATSGSEDLRSYIDKKFTALARMVELERELSDRNRELDLLRAKGNNNSTHIQPMLNSVQSELTIYQNAVAPTKRGSSSSEDFIDTSNEEEKDMDQGEPDYEADNRSWKYEPNNQCFQISEREMERAKELQRDRN